jgi:hypothetical protein
MSEVSPAPIIGSSVKHKSILTFQYSLNNNCLKYGQFMKCPIDKEFDCHQDRKDVENASKKETDKLRIKLEADKLKKAANIKIETAEKKIDIINGAKNIYNMFL